MIVSRISCATGESCLPVLAHQNWIEAPDVHVSFDIRHRGSSILLRFIVEDSGLRALTRELNGPVWEDSCVEFFLSPDGDINYYNFEFNAIGTLHAGYGPDRNSRELIPEESATLISLSPSIGTKPIRNIPAPAKWELDITIPVKALWKHTIADIAGTRARANFYKCGDKLEKPHYLSWMPLGTTRPDFHRPEFFGGIEFSP